MKLNTNNTINWPGPGDSEPPEDPEAEARADWLWDVDLEEVAKPRLDDILCELADDNGAAAARIMQELLDRAWAEYSTQQEAA